MKLPSEKVPMTVRGARSAGIPRDQYEAHVRDRWASVNVQFHGFDEEMPIEISQAKTLAQTPKRERIPPTEMLHTNQWTIEDDHLPHAAKNRKPITVVNVNGQKFVFDGNHRVMSKRMANESVSANVYEAQSSGEDHG